MPLSLIVCSGSALTAVFSPSALTTKIPRMASLHRRCVLCQQPRNTLLAFLIWPYSILSDLIWVHSETTHFVTAVTNHEYVGRTVLSDWLKSWRTGSLSSTLTATQFRWNEVSSYEMRSGEMKWGQMRWNEVMWDEVRWDELYERSFTVIKLMKSFCSKSCKRSPDHCLLSRLKLLTLAIMITFCLRFAFSSCCLYT